MGSLIVVLTAVAVCCSETYCDTSQPTAVVRPEDTGLLMRANDSRVIDRAFSLRSLGVREPTKVQEFKDLDSTANETNKRKARLLGGLAFLAGLSFGGLATAASSTVKTIAKMPQASLIVNLGPSKTSPYFTAYYSPYSPLIPYPFFYHGPFGFAPTTDHSKKPQVSSHNDLPQVISVFDNRQPADLVGNSEEYADEEKDPDDDNAADGEDGATDHRSELQAEANRNAEEKQTVTRSCKEHSRKHGNSFKGSSKERENLQMDADGSAAALKATNMTADANQNMTNREIPKQPTGSGPSHSSHHHHHHHHHVPQTTQPPSNNTEPPQIFPGYYNGYPQDISHVDLTSGSDAYRYQDHGQINYNLPYERPANFYHNDIYSSHPVSPYFPGSFSPDQLNGYVGTDFNQAYPSEYQSPYSNGFKPVK